MEIEKVTDLDEAMVLGYFESIRCTYLTKAVFLASFSNDAGKTIDPSKIPDAAISEIENLLPDPVFYKALRQGNEEVLLNYREDMDTNLFLSSWNVFEQIIKSLSKGNYTQEANVISLDYNNNRFQFGKREKKDVDLFYYLRNAIAHHNGAYYASKTIDHRYKGKDFKSEGHHGEKIEVPTMVTWEIAKDLERYSLKAWENASAR